MAIDAYRTLGLEPGASAAEVKRAYRRLAKAFHPDSAGAAALPRFLAIQDAYDRLTGASPAGTAPRTGAGAGAAGEPWRADPARARAAREQARARARAASSGSSSGSTSTGAPGRGGAAGGESGPASGQPRAGRSRTSGEPPGGSARGGAAGRGAGAGSGRRRASRKATLGSTSYDEARDAADRSWSGASWYGPTTGEYWHINPREYADPRKHGPEYQSRARRQSTTTGTAWEAEPDGTSPENRDAQAASATGGDRVAREVPLGNPRPAEAPPEPDPRAGGPGAGAEQRQRENVDDGPDQRDAANERDDRAWTPPPRPAGAADSSRDASMPGLEEVLVSMGSLLDRQPRDPVRRVGYALVAWAPIGLATAAVIGGATGCATYGASCTGAAPLIPWLVQAVILGLLLVLPRLARILAAGSAAVVLALVPSTAVVIAMGGSGEPAAPALLQTLLTVVWLIGVGLAIRGSARARRAASGAAT